MAASGHDGRNRAVKVIIWLVAFSGAIAAGYFVHITNLQAELAKAQNEEVALRENYESKFFEAAFLIWIILQKRIMTIQFQKVFIQ